MTRTLRRIEHGTREECFLRGFSYPYYGSYDNPTEALADAIALEEQEEMLGDGWTYVLRYAGPRDWRVRAYDEGGRELHDI